MLKLGVWVQVKDPNSIFYRQIGRVEGCQVHNGRRFYRLFGFWFDDADLQLWLGARS